jgi:hypothetical protein
MTGPLLQQNARIAGDVSTVGFFLYKPAFTGWKSYNCWVHTHGHSAVWFAL